MKHISLTLLMAIFSHFICKSQNYFSWREQNRTGISAETGLLKSWPTEGPKLLWSNLELFKGNSSVSFGKNIIFTTGTKDSLDYLFAIDMSGKILWQVPMGRAWSESFPESRATPTVENDKVYTCSGMGDLACFDANTGKAIWTYKASEQNKGTYGRWGIAETPLIDGDKLYFSPGGAETATIALNKNTGEIIWKSLPLGDKPGYVSPLLINYSGKSIIINATVKNVFAVDASNGEILWKVPHKIPANLAPGRDLIKCVTPLFLDGNVYVTGGYDAGGMMIKMAENGKSAEIAWTDSILDVHHGGVVLLDGYIYGSNWLNNANGNWCCIEWKTGKKMWEENWNNKGSIIAAEGLLYIYDEKKGFVGLVRPNPQKFELISSFQVTQGEAGPFWAHPVIYNGILYLRHQNALMAYDIKEK